ncbi:hypothetical protein HGP16_28370 [Rhizobium sp. P40RR-XXII]|uniref:hypothetical protein n=1 Tax=Rhizobium sp. P40RR-XXII TaxID=2726739 RepID=UPI0014567CAA|nr:hypothetical protein [Rhizobium sp. P40RR-XXII]NLS20446.1 hypothetical protein [Rhizobium sp. P40RR-XXII]
MPVLPFDKFSELESCYEQLTSWCDILEAIADFLPCHLDERLCNTMTDELPPLIHSAQRLEEQLILTNLCLIISDKEQRDTEKQRRLEWVSDLVGAEEVVDVLMALKTGDCRLSSDAARYLLRSFSCSARKHIKAEREAIRLIKALDSKDAYAVPSKATGEAA